MTNIYCPASVIVKSIVEIFFGSLLRHASAPEHTRTLAYHCTINFYSLIWSLEIIKFLVVHEPKEMGQREPEALWKSLISHTDSDAITISGESCVSIVPFVRFLVLRRSVGNIVEGRLSSHKFFTETEGQSFAQNWAFCLPKTILIKTNSAELDPGLIFIKVPKVIINLSIMTQVTKGLYQFIFFLPLFEAFKALCFLLRIFLLILNSH